MKRTLVFAIGLLLCTPSYAGDWTLLTQDEHGNKVFEDMGSFKLVDDPDNNDTLVNGHFKMVPNGETFDVTISLSECQNDNKGRLVYHMDTDASGIAEGNSWRGSGSLIYDQVGSTLCTAGKELAKRYENVRTH